MPYVPEQDNLIVVSATTEFEQRVERKSWKVTVPTLTSRFQQMCGWCEQRWGAPGWFSHNTWNYSVYRTFYFEHVEQATEFVLTWS